MKFLKKIIKIVHSFLDDYFESMEYNVVPCERRFLIEKPVKEVEIISEKDYNRIMSSTVISADDYQKICLYNEYKNKFTK